MEEEEAEDGEVHEEEDEEEDGERRRKRRRGKWRRRRRKEGRGGRGAGETGEAYIPVEERFHFGADAGSVVAEDDAQNHQGQHSGNVQPLFR